jgi:hypothetical protein
VLPRWLGTVRVDIKEGEDSMRRLLVVVILVLAMAVLMVPAVSAHNAGPCNDNGGPGHSDYAQHHIVPADLGNGAHKPGTHHGFSLCIPQAGWK